MIRVIIPKNSDFDFEKCKEMYEKYKDKINDTQDFKDIVKNTFFYSFYVGEKLIGCIYFYIRNNKLYMNGFSERHTHLINLECIKKTFDWFNCDIYAETKHKTAKYCLLKCDFKKIDDNLYIYRRE